MGTVLGGRDEGGGWRGTVGGGGSGFKEGIWPWEGQKGLLIASTIHAMCCKYLLSSYCVLGAVHLQDFLGYRALLKHTASLQPGGRWCSLRARKQRPREGKGLASSHE